jgi:hypothetical protein
VETRGEKKRGRPKGPSERIQRLGIQVYAMRNSAVPDDRIARILGLDCHVDDPRDSRQLERLEQRLDYLEKPFKGQTRRDRAARQALFYADRRLREPGGRKHDLEAFIEWVEKMKAVWLAEKVAGEYLDWLPLDVREDPFGYADREIQLAREEIRRLKDRQVEERIIREAGRRRLTITGSAFTDEEQALITELYELPPDEPTATHKLELDDGSDVEMGSDGLPVPKRDAHVRPLGTPPA